MKITYKWLKDYIDFKESPQELADKLTEAGFEVEELIPTVRPFSGVVVGRVKKVEKHPGADKLSICEVSDGSTSYQVICGAPNVAAGQTVPFAQIGASLPNGFKIKKAKIRGVASFGMICSKEELGLENASDGIWAFEEAYIPGTDVYEILRIRQDYIYDFFITANRPDCLSLIGFAREVSAITGRPFRFPEAHIQEEAQNPIEEQITVSIEDRDGCPRYAARVIKGVKIQESPQWMRQRLQAVGIRPINNIVDITNYVLMELGHPLHAFDLARLKGPAIRVRASKPAEKFITLDDKERLLPENTVMICDSERAVAIGGIMGGQNSEVSLSTVDVLLESAYFKPTRIAFSSKRLGLSSEASQRFERGTDPNGVIRAINRAASLIARIAGGRIAKGIYDVYPKAIESVQIPLHPGKINRLLGTAFSARMITEKLQSLQLKVDNGSVTVPTFRVDLTQEVDLAEEVARLVNYSNLPAKTVTEIQYEHPQPETERRTVFLRKNMLELGLQEALTASMLKKSEAEAFADNDVVEILNPISDDMTSMRPSLLPGLLKAISHNINRNMPDVRLFELGRIFRKAGKPQQLPDQPYRVAAVISGRRFPESWNNENLSVDFYDIKGYLENFISKIFLDKSHFILYDKARYLTGNETVALIAGRDEIIGLCGRIETHICRLFSIEQAVYAFELDVEKLARYFDYNRTYRPIARYPYSQRDMAVVFDEDVLAGAVLEHIKKTAGPLLRDVFIFDIYRGKKLAAGKKSLAIKMRFQSLERTLNDKEVDKLFRKIIKSTCTRFGASLRN